MCDHNTILYLPQMKVVAIKCERNCKTCKLRAEAAEKMVNLETKNEKERGRGRENERERERDYLLTIIYSVMSIRTDIHAHIMTHAHNKP